MYVPEKFKVEASFIMNPNKTEEDQQGVISSLRKNGCPFDNELADMMNKIEG